MSSSQTNMLENITSLADVIIILTLYRLLQ